MQDKILKLIAENKYQHFIFKYGENDPVAHLKVVTNNLPNEDGIYFVFSQIIESKRIQNHLIFTIEGKDYELIYFGISGGETANGKTSIQKLKRRINNVVGNKPSIARAISWNNFMRDNEYSSFKIFYCLLKQPKTFEDTIYLYLKKTKFNYPLLNKKRGRSVKKK